MKTTKLKNGFGMLFDKHSNPLFIFKDDTFSVLAFNKAALNIWGYKKKDLIKLQLSNLLYDDANFLSKKIKRSSKEIKNYGIWRFIKKDNSIFQAELIISKMKYAGKSVRLALINNQKEDKGVIEKKSTLDAIIESSEDAIIGKDLNGIITSWNPAAENIYGYSADDIIGKSITVLVPSRLRDEIFVILEKIKKGEMVEHYETLRQKKNGKIINVLLTVSPIKNSKGIVVGASTIAKDITEKKNSILKLKENEERLRIALEASGTGTFRCNMKTNILELDDNLQRLLGVPQNKVIKHLNEYLNLVHPDDRQIVKKRAINYKKKIYDYEMEYRVVWPDGSLHWILDKGRTFIDEEGKPLYLSGACMDITARKETETALIVKENSLKVSRERLRMALDAIELGTWYSDIPFNKLQWSDRCKEHFGLPHDMEITFDFFLSLIHPDNFLQTKNEIEKSIANHTITDIEFRAITPEGKIRWIRVMGKASYLSNGIPINFDAFTLDITERKIAEEKLNDSLREKETLLKEIHHRVKNNLQLILSMLNLQSQFIEDDTVLNVFKESQNRIKSMALIHEKLYRPRDLSKINFSEYVQELTSHLFNSFRVTPKQIKVEIDIKDIFLSVDLAIAIGLNINELITNSLKHAFPNHREGKIKILLKKEKNNLILIVSDNGIGFPQHLDFRNTDSLGMQLVNALVEQHGGSIELNRNGKTEFKIVFPLYVKEN